MNGTLARLLRQVRQRIDPDAGADDSVLLARWVDHADQSTFELLLWRHGQMVWDVCRRILRHEHDAEDAFQAVFITLACKASSIRQTGSLAGWLYRVAYRAALAARARPRRAEPRDDLDEVAIGHDGDLRRCLDEEIHRLPQRYRDPFVMCYLEGMSTDEAAAALACPRGTIGTRAAWARQKLRQRLSRDLPLAMPGMPLPPTLVESALLSITTAKAITPTVTTLCQEVIAMLWMNRMTAIATWLAPVLIVVAGAGGWTLVATHAGQPAADPVKPAPQPDKKPADAPAKGKPEGDKKAKPEADKNAAQVYGTVKALSADGKTITIAKSEGKRQLDETIDLHLNDKSTVLFSAIGPGEAAVKEGYGVMAWLVEGSNDLVARVVFNGGRSAKSAGPSNFGTIASVAADGKAFTIVVGSKKGDNVEKTFKVNDKTVQEFNLVDPGEARLAKDLKVSIWLTEGSEDVAARIICQGNAEVPTSPKRGGEAPAHQAVVSAVAPSGASFTIDLPGQRKKGEEPTVEKLELKLGKDSRQVFNNVGPGKAKVEVGLAAAIWLDVNAKDTVGIAVFQPAAPIKKQPVLVGKISSVADDAKSFTLIPSPTKTKGGEEIAAGTEVKVALADKAVVIFDQVPPGGAKITKDYTARVTLADGNAVIVILTGTR